MRLSDLRDVLGPPDRYRIDCLESPDYLDVVVVGARWSCGCAGQGERFSDLTPMPCPSHADVIMAFRLGIAELRLGAQAS